MPNKNLPLFLSGLAFLFIVMGLGSIFLLQPAVQTQNFDTRDAASVNSGQVTLATDFQDVSAYDSSAHVGLMVNTHGVQVDSIQVIFNVITATSDNLTINVNLASGLRATHQEVEKTVDGFLVSLTAVPSSGQTFYSTQDVNFANIDIKPTTAGDIRFSFDEGNSTAIVHGSTPPLDELKTIPLFTYSTVGNVTQNGATPAPDAGKTCNAACSSNQDCAINLRCYNNQCRLAINVTSNSCAAPADLGLQRQCNQYCADSKECASGFTCFYNQCRRPENPDNASCAALTTSSAQTIAKSCNVACSSNKECGVNLRCYNGACRLATNVSSLSCSPSTYKTVSTIYQNPGAGTKGEEIPLPSNSASSSGQLSTPSSTLTSPSPQGTASPVPLSSNSAQDLINTLFNQVSSSLAMIAIVAGAVLFILALLAMILNRARRRTPTQAGPSRVATQTNTQVESKLQQRIQELQRQPVAAPTPVAVPSQPAVQTPAPALARPQVQTLSQARPATITVASPTPPSSNSSMMDKIKMRGLDQNLPKPVPTSPPPTPTS